MKQACAERSNHDPGLLNYSTKVAVKEVFFLISKKVILKKLKRAKTTQRIQRGEQKEKEKKEKNRKQRHKETSQD